MGPLIIFALLVINVLKKLVWKIYHTVKAGQKGQNDPDADLWEFGGFSLLQDRWCVWNRIEFFRISLESQRDLG